MPIYDYACRQCGHRFEYFLLSSSPAAECPACGTKDLEQLISAYAVHSESSRQSSIKQQQKKAAVVHKDKMYEEQKQIREHHDHDH
jgi:putative FmdB family regulatory protein